MFRSKKSPVLTATFCNLMENLRLAVEVMTGKQVRFVHADFNTCNIRIRIGQEEKEIYFVQYCDGFIRFCLGKLGNHEQWVMARFDDEPGEVRVIPQGDDSYLPYFEKPCTWWVGTSFVHRWKQGL